MNKPLRIMLMLIALVYVTSFAQTEVTKSSTVTTTTQPNDANDTTYSISATPSPVQSTTTTTTTTTVKSIDDEKVAAIYAKFSKDPALIGTSLTIAIHNGIFTINGTVTAQAQADAAIEDAKSIAGDTNVRSNINVTTNPINKGPTSVPNY